MNFFVANGAVANGAPAPIYTNTAASINVSAKLTLAEAGFIRPGTSAVSGTVEATVVPTLVGGLVAAVTPSASLFSAPTKNSALSASINASAEASAFVLRDVFASADIDVSVEVVAIAAEALGEADAPAYLTVTAEAVRTQHASAAPAGAVAIPDVAGLRTASTTVSIFASASIYADTGVNDVYTAFATVSPRATVSLDGQLTLLGTAVNAGINISGFGITAAAGIVTQFGSAAPQGSMDVAAIARLNSALTVDPLTCTAGLTTSGVVTQFAAASPAACTVNFFLNEANMLHQGQSVASSAVDVTGDAYVVQPGVASVGGALAVPPVEAIRVALGTATISGDVGASTGIPTRTTQGVAGTVNVSSTVTSSAVKVQSATATLGGTADSTANGVRVLSTTADVIDISAAIPAVAGLRTLTSDAVVDTAFGCTIADGGAVYRQVFPEATYSASVDVIADAVANAESFDPPERTFIRPPYVSVFYRPEQEFVYSRPTASATFRRVA